jgi:hypothetical protein
MKSNLPGELSKVRLDLSDWVWHFTRADGKELATLLKILADGFLLGSTDQFCLDRAICFTEMPLPETLRQKQVLADANYGRMSQYGIGFRKAWIFDRGGRPVIYQPRAERAQLPAAMQWRHCDFELSVEIDFTWQREWRVPDDKLTFTRADDPTIVVPTQQDMVEHFVTSYYHDLMRDEKFVEFSWPVVTHESLSHATPPHEIEGLRCE